MCHLSGEYWGWQVGVKQHAKKTPTQYSHATSWFCVGSLVLNTTYKMASQNITYKETQFYHFAPAMYFLFTTQFAQIMSLEFG